MVAGFGSRDPFKNRCRACFHAVLGLVGYCVAFLWSLFEAAVTVKRLYTL